MPRPETAEDGITKFQRYRRKMRVRGMKQVRIWLPDPHAPSFTAEARRQGEILRGRSEEAEALDFITASFDWPQV